MAYFNDANHASYYSSVSGGVYSYPSPSQMFAIDTEGANSQTFTERANSQTFTNPIDPWSMVRRSEPMIGSPTSLRATASPGDQASPKSFHRLVSDMWTYRIGGPDNLVHEQDR